MFEMKFPVKIVPFFSNFSDFLIFNTFGRGVETLWGSTHKAVYVGFYLKELGIWLQSKKKLVIFHVGSLILRHSVHDFLIVDIF